MAVSEHPGDASDRTDPRKTGAAGNGRRGGSGSSDIPAQTSLGRGSVRVAANLGGEHPIADAGTVATAARAEAEAAAITEASVDADMASVAARLAEPAARSAEVGPEVEQPPTQAVPTIRPADRHDDASRSTPPAPSSAPAVEPVTARHGFPTPARVPVPAENERPNPELAELVVRPVGASADAVAERKRVKAATPRGRRRRPRVRRVRRVIRSIDTWTVFKVSLFFYLVAYAVVLVAGVLLWNLAHTTGTIENIQEFFKDFGWDNYQFFGDKIFRASWIIGLFLVVAGTGFNVTMAVVFNLISDLIGGIGITVLEEEVRVVPVEQDSGSSG